MFRGLTSSSRQKKHHFHSSQTQEYCVPDVPSKSVPNAH